MSPEDLAEIAQVLTVTSKKLQASVLGRKFSGRRSVEERKKISSCSARGQIGHGAGDSGCPMSQSVAARKMEKGIGLVARVHLPRKRVVLGGKNIKKTYVVGLSHEDPQHDEHDQHDMEPQSASSYFTFTTARVLGTELSTTWGQEAVDLGGFMASDTARQRSCCGEPWLKIHSKILQRLGLRVKLQDALWGRSSELTGQETQRLVFGASVLKTGIPFLAGRTLLERLGCIIDMHTKTLTFTSLGLSMPLTQQHGHLAVSIVHFMDGVATHRC